MLPHWTVNSLYPVARINVYKGGVIEVQRLNLNHKKPPKNKKPNRKAIKKMSKSSLSKLAFTVTACHIPFTSMFTLTYLEESRDGRESKKHLGKFLKQLNKRYKCSYLWFLEFTRRGKPHYHVLTTEANINYEDREWLGDTWAWAIDAPDWWYSSLVSKKSYIISDAVYEVHSHPTNWQDIRLPDGAKRYALKYALKQEQKEVPPDFQNVGRFWGCSYDVIPVPEVIGIDVTDEELRAILKDNPVADWDILPRYIWKRS